MPWKILLAGLLVFVVVGAPHAREVEVTGSATIYSNNVGGARTQALKNAQRQAVEQGVGVVIDSNTLARNYEVIRDEILSTSQGFVSNYEILKEGTVGGSVFEVTIRAEVEEGKIKDTLTALRILHKKMGNKRLMIVYHSQDPHALPRDNGAVTTTLGAVREEFNKAGFRMFNDQQMTRIYQAIEQEALVDR
ncbi:MAG: flagellar assembly protein T N-terminal domain-containing protein, partial [SAR324 cluster bacterium]|nr:flagellar assembly protein T N-terminal domain-containing protein [SAR324 cluster bacterium]